MTQHSRHEEPNLAWVQALAFKLGAQQWEFEAARDAFGDTMRKFAPGGGAGHFLARAIARRSEQVRDCSCSADVHSLDTADYYALQPRAISMGCLLHSTRQLLVSLTLSRWNAEADADASSGSLQICLLLHICFSAYVPFAGMCLLALCKLHLLIALLTSACQSEMLHVPVLRSWPLKCRPAHVQEARARCADKQGGAAEAGQRAAAALAASLALSSMDTEPRVVDARAQLTASPAKPVPAQG